MGKKKIQTADNQLLLENQELHRRMLELEETLNAIRNGEIDAILVSGADGERIYSLATVETRYRIIIEEMYEGAITLTTNGLITYCNARFAELVSEPIERIIGSYFDDFLEEGEKQVFRGLLQSGLKRKSTGELTYLRKDGHSLNFLLSVSVLPDENLNGVCILVSDITELIAQKREMIHLNAVMEQKVTDRTSDLNITINELAKEIAERKRSENALRETELLKSGLLFKYNEAQHISKIGSWEWDLKSNQVWWSDETYLIFGTTPPEYHPDFESNGKFIHPDDLEPYGRMFEHSFQTGEPLFYECRLIMTDGRLKYCEARGKLIYDEDNQPVSFIGTIADITERKMAEQLVQTMSKRLELALRSSGVGTWDWDIINGNIVWSSHMFQLLGLDQQKNIASFDNWRAVLHPEDIELAETRIGEAFKGHSQLNSDYRVILPNGQIRWINATGEGIYDERESQVQMVGICIDITERKESELRLKESENKFKNLIWDMQVGVLLQGPKSEILLSNPKSLELLGMSEDQLMGKTSLDPDWNVIHEDGSPFPGNTHPVPQAIETGLPVRSVIMGVYNPVIGDRLWLLVDAIPQLNTDGTIKQIVCTFINITKRKQAEEALKNSKARFEALLLQAPSNGVIYRLIRDDVGNIRDLEITDINEQGAGSIGLVRATAIGKRASALFGEQVMGPYFEIAQQVTDSGQPRIFETWFESNKRAYLTSVFLLDPDHYANISVDITDLKNAESQIKQLNEELEQKVLKRTEQLHNSNKELEAFSYSISHDLRAPLRAVNGYTNILLEEYEDKLDDEAKRLCRIISSSAIKMSALIDDLLSFSRIGRTSVKPGVLDMNSLVESVLVDSTVAEKINRVNYITAKLHTSFGDANLIKLVWNNLIYNAIKYSSKELNPEIAIGSKNEGNMITYFIKDNGVGFDMKYINKLFGVFQRLHSETEFEGNGVGLAIVQRIISKHGGHVWAEGEVGKGATFWFCLPASG